MWTHSLKNVQKIPISLEQAWGFYSDPIVLQLITPPNMQFNVISQDQGKKIYPGQIIEYKVSPLFNISLNWKTEITHVTAPIYFVDIQRKGPYRFWQHQHYFKAIEGGVEMTDIIVYKNPLWVLGEIANVLFIKKKLRTIFEFRFRKVEELFGKWQGGQEFLFDIK